MRHARHDYMRIQDPARLIPIDEPVFLIRGQDALAPDIVREYAKRAREAGCEKIADRAERHAKLMDEWQQKKKKLPDLRPES